MSGTSGFNIERGGLREIYNGSSDGVSVHLKIPAGILDDSEADDLGRKVYELYLEAQKKIQEAPEISTRNP